MRYQIDCINRREHNDSYAVISHVGGPNVTGFGRYRFTVEDAINRIKKGWDTFFVYQSGYSTDVVIAESWRGNLYLKTQRDGTTLDNLGSLSACPLW
jgi:hypothetical protein